MPDVGEPERTCRSRLALALCGLRDEAKLLSRVEDDRDTVVDGPGTDW